MSEPSKADDFQSPNSLDTSDDDLLNSKTNPSHHRPNLLIRFLSNRNIGLSLFIIPLTVANALYINSNEPCPCNEFDALACVFRFVLYNLDKWMTDIFIAALIFATFILLPIFWKYKTLKLMSLATIVNVIYLAGFHDNKITVLTYGQAFGMLLALYMILIFLSFAILCLIFKALKRRPILTLFTLVVIISTSSYAFYYGKYENSCGQWAKGLGGDEIDNTVGCKIDLPETCVLDMLEGVIDLSFWDCKSSLYKADPKLIEQYYPKAPIIGLPRIEYAPKEQRVYLHIQNYIFQNSVGLESFDDPKAKNLEIFIDQRDKEDVKFVIDVKRNESLVQQKAKLQDNNAVSNNVLVIFIDSISRARMFKKLTKTIAWLDKLYNKKNPDKESFQFFKFHGITPYTMHNVLAANFGYIPPDNKPAPLIKATSFVSEFHSKGYITARTSDHCDIAQTLSGPRLAHVEDIPFDHEGMPFACDPHHHIPESPYGLFTGAYSMRRKCLYGEDTFQTTLEYGNQFWRAYPGEKKLLWMDFLDAHEATQESVKYLDDPLASFLENLDKDKLLEDTMVIFWSDHGNHMPFPPYSLIPSHTNQERALPMLFLVVPTRALPAYRQNLKENSQKLVTAFQIYHLLVTIPNGQEYFRKDLGLLGKVPELGCTSNRVHDQACFCLYGK